MLDSVVGAFLTQNAADVLSSQAFMALAARFPPSACKRQAASTAPAQTPQQDLGRKRTASSAGSSLQIASSPRRMQTDVMHITSPQPPVLQISVQQVESLAVSMHLSHEPDASMRDPELNVDMQQIEMLDGTMQIANAAMPATACADACHSQISRSDEQGASCQPSSTVLASEGDAVPNEGLPACSISRHDNVCWEAVLAAPAADLAETIKCRGMHNKLTTNIQVT